MNSSSQIRHAKLAKRAALIKEQSESTLTVKEWCDQNNVTIHAYHYWKHRLLWEIRFQDQRIFQSTMFSPGSRPDQVFSFCAKHFSGIFTVFGLSCIRLFLSFLIQ